MRTISLIFLILPSGISYVHLRGRPALLQRLLPRGDSDGPFQSGNPVHAVLESQPGLDQRAARKQIRNYSAGAPLENKMPGAAADGAQRRRRPRPHHHRDGEGLDPARSREQTLGADLREREQTDQDPQRSVHAVLRVQPEDGADCLHEVLADIRCR